MEKASPSRVHDHCCILIPMMHTTTTLTCILYPRYYDCLGDDLESKKWEVKEEYQM
jgi:hypothetical protein